MDNFMAMANSGMLYLIAGVVIAFVMILAAVFLVKAYREGVKIGMDKKKMHKAITSSIAFTVVPSVSILIGVIALSGSLGIPIPWLRLSVIGALHYETQVAQAAAEQVGMKSLSAAEMTPAGFATIALLMSLCIIWGIVLSILFNKRYTKKLSSSPAGGKTAAGFGDLAMTAMFIGLVSAYIGSYLGGFISANGRFTFSGDWTPLAVAAVSAGVMALFVYLAEKKHITWVENFSIAGSMLAGMAAAVLIGLV